MPETPTKLERDLSEVQKDIDKLEKERKKLYDKRARLIGRALAAKISQAKIGRITGLTRAAIYKVNRKRLR